MTIVARGINNALRQFDNDIDQFVADELRERSLAALADVKLANPVDSGFSRDSWYVGYIKDVNNVTTPGITILMRSDRPQEIVVYNSTTYIQFLNNGSSQQSPPMFVEQSFRRHFDSVEVRIIEGGTDQ